MKRHSLPASLKRAFAWTPLFVLPLRSAHAVRPLTIDDAEPVAPRAVQIEASAEYLRHDGLRSLALPFGVRYGLHPRLDAGLFLGGLYQHDDSREHEETAFWDHQDLFLTAKWKWLDQEKAGLSLAFTPTLKVPLADPDRSGTGEFDFEALLIATRRFGGLSVDANFACQLAGDAPDLDHPDLLRYGVALRQALSERWSLVGEVFAISPVDDWDASWLQFGGGLQFLCRRNLALDAYAGTGLGDDAPYLVLRAGVTWIF